MSAPLPNAMSASDDSKGGALVRPPKMCATEAKLKRNSKLAIVRKLLNRGKKKPK